MIPLLRELVASRQLTPKYRPVRAQRHQTWFLLCKMVMQVHTRIICPACTPPTLPVRSFKTHLLVGKNQEYRISELVFGQHSLQLALSFGDTFSIIAIHNEYKSCSEQMNISEVRSPKLYCNCLTLSFSLTHTHTQRNSPCIVTLRVLEVVPPERSDFVLSAHVPDCETDVLVFDGLHVEPYLTRYHETGSLSVSPKSYVSRRYNHAYQLWG